MATIPAAAEVMLEHHPPAELEPGDAILSNLPYPIGPGHLSDVALLTPVFSDRQLVALLVNMAHHVDMGGYALKCIIDPDLPTNHGAYRPVEVIAEEGSLVQATFPAAVCNANILTDQRLVDVVLGALVDAVPDRVTAACSGEMNLVNLGGINEQTGVLRRYARRP